MTIDFERAVDRATADFAMMTAEELVAWNDMNDAEHRSQYLKFIDGYRRGSCYLCNKDFKTVSKESPCVHWLLRRGKFKNKDINLIARKFGYINICAYLRWCANAETLVSNINDLKAEAPKGKILSSTIKWKNIEWSFDCSPNDLAGHAGAHTDFPHYHFQMRIDGRQFINFNDYHLPFSSHDLFMLRLSKEPGILFDFGLYGMGMQEAMDIDPEDIVNHTSPTENEAEAMFNIHTVITSSNQPLRGEDIAEALEESKRTGRTMASIFKERFEGSGINVKSIISPSEAIPKITPRTEHKPR